MTDAELLAEMLPPEVIELMARELPRVTYPGTSKIKLCHGPEGRITDGWVKAAPPRAKVRQQKPRD